MNVFATTSASLLRSSSYRSSLLWLAYAGGGT